MFSRIVPLNSQASWRTIPNVRRRSSRVSSRVSMPSTVIRPPSHVVEAHQQVDQRGLAGAGRPDDRHGLAGLHDQGQVLDQRLVRLVAERHVLEGRRGPRALGQDRRASTGSGISSGSSSSSKTRSAEATADCRTLAIEATWMIGKVNWREYWMNAWTSPRRHLAVGHPDAADDADRDVVEVAR